MKTLFLFFFVWCPAVVFSGNYLFWMPICSKSVKIGVMDAGLELARRGHNITIVSPFKSKKETPGVTEIINKSTFNKLQEEISEEQLTRAGADILIGPFLQVSLDDNEDALTDPKVIKLLNTEDIDVLITVPMFGNEVGYYLAHKINASLVVFITGPISLPFINWDIGDPFNPSYVPVVFTGFTQHMNFQQRFINTIVTGMSYFVTNWYSRYNVDNLLSEVYAQDNIPKTSSLAKDIALVVNHGSPFLGDGLRPVSPKSIMGALMTCGPAKQLPEDLKSFVEGAEHGVIFVSFGSILRASKMPEFKRQIFLSVFSKLKQKVIWKWEAEMPDAPPNVMISSWLPQPDLLGHPNVKLFVTHGGAGSFQDTICHKTPVVGIPIGMDQFEILGQAVTKGIGVRIGWHEITEENLSKAIDEVLSNPAFYKAVAKLNSQILDQPQHPLDRVVWWMEYLLRHPSNKDMKSPAPDLYWFQYFLIDVIFVICIVTGVILLILFYITKVTLTKCCFGSNKSKKE